MSHTGVRLNPTQRAAARHRGGPLLIVAGPGTGKTTVMVARAAFLVQASTGAEGSSQAAPPAEAWDGRQPRLLLLTFTRAARHQLARRLRRHLEDRAAAVQVATFHALAWRLLRRFAPQELPPGRDALTLEPERRVRRSRKQDTSWGKAMMKKAVKIARRQRRQLAGIWDELLIDEFQDTDARQYRLATLLTPPSRRITVVGDDDQAIYGWRGAVPDLFRRFEDDHTPVQRVTLNRSYRAHHSLIQFTNRMAAGIPGRLPKRLQAVRRCGPRPRLLRPLSAMAEARRCLQWLQATARDAPPTAVIYRLRRAADPLLQLLDAQRLPYTRLDEGETLPMVQAAPPICRDLLSYRKAAQAAKTPFAVSQPATTPTPVQRQQLLRLARLTPAQAVSYICRGLGYEQVLYRRHGGGEALDAAMAVLKRAAAMPTWDGVRRLAETTKTPHRLVLTTAHGAKGLEFHHVWILGAVDGWFPLTRGPVGQHERQPEWFAEEQRLFYVACTRAAERLTISAPRWLAWGPARLTRFLQPHLHPLLDRGMGSP